MQNGGAKKIQKQNYLLIIWQKDQCDDSFWNELFESNVIFVRQNLCMVHFFHSLPVNIITFVYSVSCKALLHRILHRTNNNKNRRIFFTFLWTFVGKSSHLGKNTNTHTHKK